MGTSDLHISEKNSTIISVSFGIRGTYSAKGFGDLYTDLDLYFTVQVNQSYECALIIYHENNFFFEKTLIIYIEYDFDI